MNPPALTDDADCVTDRDRPASTRTPAASAADEQRLVQLGAPHPEPGTRAERRERRARPVGVPDAAKRRPRRRHPERGERRHRARHQPLAARLVDRARPRLEDDARQAGAGRVQRGRPVRPVRRRTSRSSTIDHDAERAERAVLGADPHPQQHGVQHRERHRGDPRGVHQWQRSAFEHHRHVVRMAEQPVRPAADQRAARHHDDARVPLPSRASRCTTSAAPARPPRPASIGQPEPRDERPVATTPRPRSRPAARCAARP